MLKLKVKSIQIVSILMLCTSGCALSSDESQPTHPYFQALEQARAAQELNIFISLDEKIDITKVPSGRLSGMVLGVKDNVHVKGLPNTAGTPALKDFFPQEDAAIIKRLKSEGAVILGKTNLHELTFGITSNNVYFGAVKNPYDHKRFAGGSSGGSAAAIAARIVPAAIGTDTGGSMRIPAALSGVIGFRPTKGRYPEGGVAIISPTRDVTGPMALSMNDITLLDSVMANRSQITNPANLKTLRLGVPRGALYDDLEEETASIIEQNLEKLRAAGVTLVEVDIDNLRDVSRKASGPIPVYEAVESLLSYLEENNTGVSFFELVEKAQSPNVVAVLKRMAKDEDNDGVPDGAVSKEDYDNAINKYRPALIQLFEEYFAKNKLDAIVFPTTVRPASMIEGSHKTVKHNGRDARTFSTYIRNTAPGSAAGMPGISLPMGITSEGLPVGMALDALPGGDDQLLSIALAVDSLLDKIPPPQ